MTLDQERARFAWERAIKNRATDGYREMAKGASALIMGSGLMPALAYWHSRADTNAKAALALCGDVLGWLAIRKFAPDDFRLSMESLLNAQDPLHLMHVTDEALAMLRWLRQFADATATEDY